MRYSRVFFAPGAFQLQQQALAQVARRHAGGMKFLDDLEHLHDLFRDDVGGEGQFVHRGLEVTPLIHVADDHLGDGLLFLRHLGKTHLFQQCLLQRRARHQGIEHELPLLLRVLALAHRQVGLRKMVPPLLVRLHQPLELHLKIVHRRVARLFRGRIELHVRRRLRQVRRLGRGIVLAAVLDTVVQLHFGGGDFLQQRILRQLLFHQRLQFQRRRLQQGQRLLQLRRQHLRQRHPLR